MRRTRQGQVPIYSRRLTALGLALSLALATRGWAHEGPPFPLVMDHAMAGCSVSVWADPDIGEARFFVVIERADRAGPPPIAPQVALWVEPISGRLARADYPAEPQELRNQMQFLATPHFDQRDMWRVGVQVTVAGGPTAEYVTQVESTPPGWGRWDLVIYLFPFLLFGGLWVVASVRRRLRPPPTHFAAGARGCEPALGNEF